jgi:ribosomal protein S18 acetylase RimI-like enzyme
MSAIRDMEPGDVAALVAIEQACFAAGYADKMMTAEDFAEVPGDEHAALFCAIENDEVAGYAFLLLEDGAANFDSLAVSPSHQGKGLGEKLFRHVERYCQDNAIPRLNLEIKETNYPLLKRYHGYGYKCFEVESGFYADGWGAIRMLKHFDV